MAAMEITVWLLATFLLAGYFQGWFQVPKWRVGPDAWLGAFFGLVTLSALVNAHTFSEGLDIVGWARWIALLYIFTWCFRQFLTPRWERWHGVLLGLCCLLGVYAIIQFLYGVELVHRHYRLNQLGDYFRASGFFTLCLTFAYQMGMAGLTALALALEKANSQKIRESVLAAFAFGFCTLAVILSLTRGAWLAYGIACFIGIAIASQRRWIVLAPTAGLVLVAILAKGQFFLSRVTSLLNPLESSNYLHVLVWKANWLIFLDHPLLGVGLGLNTPLMPQYYAQLGYPTETFKSHAHNDLLQMLAGVGLFGALCYIIFCAWFLRAAYLTWRRLPSNATWYRSLALGSFLAQIYFHIGALTQCNFTNGINNHLLIFLWALTAALYGALPTSDGSLRS
jgi:O-antigen ligase